MTALCTIVVMLGVGAVLLGATLYWWRYSVDVGVYTDQDMLDRLDRTHTVSSDQNKKLATAANASLGYHQSLRDLYLFIAKSIVVGGVVTIVVGGLQFHALRALRRSYVKP